MIRYDYQFQYCIELTGSQPTAALFSEVPYLIAIVFFLLSFYLVFFFLDYIHYKRHALCISQYIFLICLYSNALNHEVIQFHTHGYLVCLMKHLSKPG